MNTTVSCKQCPKTFTHPTKAKAEQALLMHVGRKHRKNIVNQRHSGVLVQHTNGALVESKTEKRSHLSREQTESIISFIQQNHTRFGNKTACLNAALEAAGATGKLVATSTAVSRYFKKAEAAPAVKRQYIKRVKQPVVREVHVNFCPGCGCNLQAVATGMAMATVN